MPIFNQKENTVSNETEPETPDAFGYTEWAADIDPAQLKSYCKKEQYQDFARYYVKISPNGTLFDPWGSEANVRVTEYGRNHFEYKKVDETVFSSYLDFLKTKNASYLRNAQRKYNEKQ